MDYGSQTIQQQGWGFEIRKEERSVENKHAKGKRCPKDKAGEVRITKDTITFKTGHTVKLTKSYIDRFIMDEYRREQKAFPDWRYIASREMDKAGGRKRYASLTPEERTEVNRIARTRKDMDKHRKQQRAYRKNVLMKDPNYRIKCAIRARFAKIRKGGNSVSMLKYLGCNVQSLKIHLESKFKKGMNWENYGTHWHIDHIIPCKHFDHTNLSHIKQCWHWTNLEPMEASANCSKGSKIIKPQMSLLI